MKDVEDSGHASTGRALGTASATWSAAEGLPFPLGATWLPDGSACNFALYSKHAENVTLLVYGPSDIVAPILAYPFDYLRNKSERIWHCRIPRAALDGAAFYAYRIDGPVPGGRDEWHHFDPEKILLDPYALRVYLPPTLDRMAASRPGSNVGKAPLSMLPGAAHRFDWRGSRAPRHEADTIIYEVHVRGFTANGNSGVDEALRGTYRGVVEKIPYLVKLGVTVVELMPVFQFDPSDDNYWGYSPLSFFAPHDGYLTGTAGGAHDEFDAMIHALHEAGIEVVLDVVYNHTTEGDERGPVYAYKGIDNSTYYLMSGYPEAPYQNFSGTGNTLNCANRYVRKLIMDSVRHWARDMRVDGFRFDLASVFARKADGTIDVDDVPLLSDLASDPALATLRVIVEPWDAAGVDQVSRAFPGVRTARWNSRFRDDVRRFVRGDPGLVGAIMRRLYGSDDLFPDDREHACHPFQSINYVTCHDGFTLHDLVAFDRKHNWANGQSNADGADENFSWNCGHEGVEGAPADVVAMRKRQVRNFCCLLLLANGTPMFRAGDEFMHTQQGNNNPWNQDNETSWIDWSKLEENADVFRFFRLMIDFRKRHPSLCRSRFWRDDVRWYGVGRDPDLGPDSRSLAFALHGTSQGDDDLYVLVNAWSAPLTFAVQEGAAGEWRRAVDTSLATPDDIVEAGDEAALATLSYRLPGRAIAVLARSPGTLDAA